MPKLNMARLQQIADELKKPKLSIRQLEKEAGLHIGTYQKILNGTLVLTDYRAKALEKVIKKHKL